MRIVSPSVSRIFVLALPLALIVALLAALGFSGKGAAATGKLESHSSVSAVDICTANSIHTEGKISHLCPQVRVENGRPKVDRDKTRVFLTDEFIRRLGPSKLTLDQVKKVLFDRIDVVLGHSDRLISYALTPEQKKAVTERGCEALAGEALKDARALCEFTGAWDKFISDYVLWRPTVSHSTPDPDRLLFNPGIDRIFPEIHFDSALYFTEQLPDGFGYDGTAGVFFLRVANPISKWTDPEYTICISNKCSGKRSDDPRTVSSPQDIRNVLKPLNGHLWNQGEIKSIVQEYYGGKGLLATVEVGSPFAEEGEVVRIKESPRLLSVNFPREMEASKVDKAMYLLVPDRQFRRFMKCRDDFTPAADGISPLVVEIKELLRKGSCGDPEDLDEERPYLNLIKLQSQTLQLNSIDLDVEAGSTTDEGEEFVFLQVFDAEESDKKSKDKKSENDEAAPLANPQGRVDPSLTRPETQDSFAPRLTVQPSPAATPAPTPSGGGAAQPSPAVPPTTTEPEVKKKEKKNYVGGGFEFSSGQGIRAFGIYQRTKLLFGNDGLSLQLGANDKGLGSINYYADYVAFSHLQRKLTLQFTGSSEVNAQRLFGGTSTDERRTGGLARAEIELFRDRGGNLLRLSAEAQRMTVELTQKDKTVGKQNLSTLDFGAFYLLQPDYELKHPRWARLEPRLRFGLGLAQGEPRFQAFFMSGNFHQKLPGFFEVDVTGHLGLTSEKTPFFEQATLGGTESVRGFRQDEAIGQRTWSLQNELWIPLPGTTNSAGEFQRFLLRSVRFTAFTDIGGASRTFGSQPGLRYGPGAGFRFIFNPIVMKLDWAYGFTSAQTTTGRGRFSFSIVSNLPF